MIVVRISPKRNLRRITEYCQAKRNIVNALFFRQSMLREALSTNASCLSPSILSERNRLILIKLERIYFVIFSGCVRECISYMAYLWLDVSSNTPKARDTWLPRSRCHLSL